MIKLESSFRNAPATENQQPEVKSQQKPNKQIDLRMDLQMKSLFFFCWFDKEKLSGRRKEIKLGKNYVKCLNK